MRPASIFFNIQLSNSRIVSSIVIPQGVFSSSKCSFFALLQLHKSNATVPVKKNKDNLLLIQNPPLNKEPKVLENYKYLRYN